jgi:hypothetical protein
MKICMSMVMVAVMLCSLATVPSHADVGRLSLSTDDTGWLCEFNDPGGVLITVFVVHKLYIGNSTGVRFRIEPPAGAAWSYLGFNTTFVPIGTANLDLSVGYGQCLTGSATVGTALWYSFAASPSCGTLAIEPATGFQTMIATDCSFGEFPITGSNGVVNGNNSCCCNCGATKPTTWGSVKGLYR